MFQGPLKRMLLAGMAVLLVAVLVGPSGAAEPRAVTKIITIPAAAFSPDSDDVDFYSYGALLRLSSGDGRFMAPVFFESRDVTVNDFTLYTRDGDATKDVCVSLMRTAPWKGDQQFMGKVCSTGTGAGVRNFTQTSLAIRTITGSYGPYLWLDMPSSSTSLVDGLTFFSVRINYTYTP